MDLLVIGAGPVGRALARPWTAAGHAVSVAVRDPGDRKHDAYRAEHRLSSTGELPPADAAALAIPGAQLPALLEVTGPQLDGRLVIDATHTPSGARMHQLPLLAQRLPSARLFRTFTITGWENFAGDVAGQRPDMLYTGPDGDDRVSIERLIADVGPRPLWLGDGPSAADALDGLTRIWFTLAMARGHGRHLAFRVLTPEPEHA
jgi:predicted dinucleotide-binding enzyme